MKEYFPFLVSILLGFLIGIEREKTKGTGAMGVRTFTLIAILGSLCGWSREIWLMAASSLFVLGLVLSSYFRATGPGIQKELGLTTEVAAGVVFALGYIAHRDPALAGLLGCFVALLLFWKTPLHRFTSTVRPRELEAALLLLLLGISVLGFLEDKVIDPWGLFNPRKFGMVILLVAAIEFSSYLAVKFIGPGKSPIVVGFFAGLVSSTALLLTSARAAKKNPNAWTQHLITVAVGKVASLLLLVVVVGVVSADLIGLTALLVSGAVLVGILTTALFLGNSSTASTPIEVRSPLDILGVLRLSLFLAAILAAVGLAQRHAGDLGRETAAFIGGLFELQGVSLATATLHERGQLEINPTLVTLELAVIASLVGKIVISWVIVRGKFSVATTALFLAMGIAVVLMAWVMPSLPSPV